MIGSKKGYNLKIRVDGTNLFFNSFTTRVDNLFGATFCLISPKNKYVLDITNEDEYNDVVEYLKNDSKEIAGVFTGSFAINPINGKMLPIWVSNYFLDEYDNDFKVCVPSTDELDFEFASYYGLDIIPLIDFENVPYSGNGIHINSDFVNDLYNDEGRIITLEFKEYFLICMYVPNVKRDLSRLDYRMNWEDDFKKYVKELEKSTPVVICGDFNVCHTENDIKNAKANIGKAGFTYEERNKFTKLLESGLIDTWRYFNPTETNKFTWWSYMGNARANNVGWRLDYFLISKDYIDKVKSSEILDNVMGSDHCPIELNLEME